MLRRWPQFRLCLFALLALATLLRPMLIVACDVHAAAHAHASQPHVHAADDAGAASDGHGDHQSLLQGSLAAVADAVPSYVLAMPAFATAHVPEPPPAPVPAHYAGAPFRPPIA